MEIGVWFLDNLHLFWMGRNSCWGLGAGKLFASPCLTPVGVLRNWLPSKTGLTLEAGLQGAFGPWYQSSADISRVVDGCFPLDFALSPVTVHRCKASKVDIGSSFPKAQKQLGQLGSSAEHYGHPLPATHTHPPSPCPHLAPALPNTHRAVFQCWFADLQQTPSGGAGPV